jgi:hypothetical protein
LSAANVTLKSTGNGLGAATYFFANTQSFGNIQLGSEAGQIIWRYQINVASFGRVTFNTMTINPVSHVELQSGVTVTTTLTANGTAFNNSIILDNIAAVNFIIPNNTTFNWCVIKNYQSTATGVTATNSLDLGHNSSITITGPAAGGGSGIIGS